MSIEQPSPKNPELEDLCERMSVSLFKRSQKEAIETGVCLSCNQPALPRCYSEAGRREFEISGLCEVCFDEICSEGN